MARRLPRLRTAWKCICISNSHLLFATKLMFQFSATVRDESGYSCRIKNDAGETRVDYKLQVLVPPSILMLEKDKHRYISTPDFNKNKWFRNVVENKTITLSCPATGKPEPTILWLKDGQPLNDFNISKVISSAQIVKNEIKISRVNVSLYFWRYYLRTLRYTRKY